MSDDNIISFNHPDNPIKYYTKQFQDKTVRYFLIKNTLKFVGKDIATIAGYSNPKDAIKNNCTNQKPVTEIFEERSDTTPIEIKDLEAFDVQPHTILIPSSDVYRLVYRSKNEELQDWTLSLIEELNDIIRENIARDNKNVDFEKEFSEIKEQLKQIASAKPVVVSNNTPTVKLVGMPKKDIVGGIDVETFCNQVNSKYNRSHSRNVIYSILRDLNYICERNTEPTDFAYKNGFIDLAAGYIFYSDGSRSKTVKTIITEKTVDIIIHHMKGKRYI